jgi:DNA-binding NtrC family response regulator
LAKVLIVEDQESMLESLAILFRREGYEVACASSGGEALESLSAEMPDLVLVDFRLPDTDGLKVLKAAKELSSTTEVVMITAYGTVESAVQAMKEGAYDYIVKPFSPDEIVLAAGRALEKKRLSDRVRFLEERLRQSYRFDEIVGKSQAMLSVLKMVSQVCTTDSTVLITGESGTGKELITQAIHFNSSRREGPFVVVNFAAIPEHLQESELFGHARGAFTDAKQDKKGLLEEAHEGTLFLDEIGEASPSAQTKLLRFLQDGEVRRVGDNYPRHLSVRLIAATNKNLGQEIKEGRFREDLFYRLNVVPIHLPPLRERKEDIPLLVDHFLDKLGKKLRRDNISIDKRAVNALLSYDWPGNVRELENIIERLMILSQGGSIGLEDLPTDIREGEAGKDGMKKTLAQVEKKYILEALHRSGGNRRKAALELGISSTTLWRKMKAHRITPSNLKSL